jgi:hypothetical protein
MSTETTKPRNISGAPAKSAPPKAEKPLVNRRIMDSGVQLLRKRNYKELWQQTCGFIDLSLPEVMTIQNQLMLEQLPRITNSEIGKAVMRGASPRTVAEFRKQVPLTTYKDYSAFLLKRQENSLPVQPLLWGHTSGRTGEYDFKWCPLTSGQWEEIEKLTFAAFAFCSCSKREEIKLRLHDKLLYGAAPAPYVTGLLSRYAFSRIFDFLPPLDEAEAMSFQERGKQGITQALTYGLDYYSALPSVLVNVAERMGQGGKKDPKAFLKNPRLAVRIIKGLLRSKLAHRPMLPKDVWTLKGLISAGSDGSVYKDKIREMWGRTPLDMYACTEGLVISLQTWDYEGLCFYPSLNFFEFIPEEDVLKSKLDSTFKPRTFLLDEVEPGQNYQLAISNFHGGPFVRYVVGDMVRITARRNDRLNIDIPQMVYHSRVDDMIDIAGFTRLTESVIWKALEQSGIAYEDWTARKELKGKPILRIYIEPKGKDGCTPEYYAGLIHEELRALDKPYGELESYLGLKPLEVTLIPEGAFNRFMLNQMQAGVELGRMKVSHLNPPDKVIDFLVNYRNK